MKLSRETTKEIVLGAFILFVVVGIVVAWPIVVRYIEDRSQEHYRSMGAGEVLIAYMEQNENRWPSDWDDLERFMGEREYVGIRSFADLKKYLDIDFSFKPNSIDTAAEVPSNPSFNCMWLRSGRKLDDSWECNRLILNYLIRVKPTGSRDTA